MNRQTLLRRLNELAARLLESDVSTPSEDRALTLVISRLKGEIKRGRE